MKYTTIEDLYKWAVKNNALNLPIGIHYQDGGGYYYGDTFTRNSEDKEVMAEVSSYDGVSYVILS